MIKSSLIISTSKVTVALLALLLNWFLANRLSVDEFGHYSFLLNFINILAVFFLLGSNVSHIYYKKKGDDNFKPLLSIYSILSFIFLALYFFVGSSNIYFIVIANSFLIAGLSILNSNAQAVARFMDFSIQIIIYAFFGLFAIFIGVTYFGISTGEKVVLISFVGSFVAFFALSSKSLLEKGGWQFKNIRSFFKYGSNSFFLNLQGQALYFSDVFIINYLMTSEDVAYYTVSALAAKLLWLFIDSMGIVLFPNLINGNYQQKLLKVKRAIIVTSIICLIPTAVFFLIGDVAIDLAFGSQYESSYGIANILILSSYPLILYKLCSRLIASECMWSIAHFSLGLSLVVNVLLNFILIPEYGLTGAAIASFVSYLICGVLVFHKVNRVNDPIR